MAWAAHLHAVMQQHAWAAAVQSPGGVAEQFAAHQALLVALRTQQVGAAGGGAAAAAGGGNSANEASSFGTAVDQGHKSLVEMHQERQVLPNMESRGSKVPHLFHGHSYHNRTSRESALFPHVLHYSRRSSWRQDSGGHH